MVLHRGNSLIHIVDYVVVQVALYSCDSLIHIVDYVVVEWSESAVVLVVW
uniref:Uncharacterized protein n=1 Tax=Octopus bimaculoides TaxID=37653 RepID=A0A0L8FJL6_OCTBM